MGPNASNTRIGSSVAAGSECVHKRRSEQSRAGVTAECFGVAAVGLEHLERLVAGDIRDLDQIRASLHRTRHEAGAQRMAAKRWRAFFGELRRLGYVEGENLIIERYSAEGYHERYSDLVREIVTRNPDVIVTGTNPVVIAFKAATSTIPVVAFMLDGTP
jgi:ABC transporter substrate binding protein